MSIKTGSGVRLECEEVALGVTAPGLTRSPSPPASVQCPWPPHREEFMGQPQVLLQYAGSSMGATVPPWASGPDLSCEETEGCRPGASL